MDRAGVSNLSPLDVHCNAHGYMNETFDDVAECVDAALAKVGRRIVLALPLGIGKPAAVANEFWRRALRDVSLQLTIITALSLRKPPAGSDLERRFAAPLLERVFGDYEELDYVQALHAGALPPNVRIIEFFLEPGAALSVAHSQQNYLSANYTHVARELTTRGVNVLAHLIAKRAVGGDVQYSLGSNTDVTLDLIPEISRRRAAGETIITIGQVHNEMPFMAGSALAPADFFNCILEHTRYDRRLFCPPNPSLASVDHAIGLHASALIRDGGTLQIGIGELGDAICYALLLRHQQNASWQQALHDIGTERFAKSIDELGGRDAFAEGIFGSTEMFVDQMLELHRAGILRRRVYDSLPLSRLIANGNITDKFDARILEDLNHVGVGPTLTEAEFDSLQNCGVFRPDCRYECGRIRSADSDWCSADLSDAAARFDLARGCLGRELRNGHVMHAGFFLGPRGFYAALRDMPEAERAQFDMRGVSYINQLYGAEPELRILQRRDARFVNTTMMITLYGAAVSDGLEDGRVVSGVGGQYNFVAMAHALPGARSVLCVRSTRTKDGRTTSNIVPSYGHVTIPRHLRDVVITEYGVADLRGRTDSEIVAALLNIADSRFQRQLLRSAQAANKISGDYVIPPLYRNNTPAQLERSLSSHRNAGLFSEYPFGTDLTEEEIMLARALRHLKSATATSLQKLITLGRSLLREPAAADLAPLRRMGLSEPTNWKTRMLQRLVVLALQDCRGG